MTFEEVAALLWQADAGRRLATSGHRGGDCPLVDASDRMHWALVMCGAADPLRADLRPAAVTRAARRVIAALTDVVGDASRGAGTRRSGSIALRLAQRLSPAGRRQGDEEPHCRRPPSMRRWSSWPITSWRPPPLPCVWLPPPGPISTTRCWPASPPWPDRCTVGRASVPTNSWRRPNATGRPGRSMTRCAGRAFCPASGTRSTRSATRASTRCGSWRHRCSARSGDVSSSR